MPVPSQALSVQYNHITFTIDLDSGATVGFIRQDIALYLDLNIKENGQFARLADKKTQMKSLGEIDIIVTETTTCSCSQGTWGCMLWWSDISS